MKSRHIFLFVIVCLIPSYGIARNDSVRHYLESIGEKEPYISALADSSTIPYDSVVYFYEIGASYNRIGDKWTWSFEPSRVQLTHNMEYYMNRIIRDSAVVHIHRLFNWFVKPSNNDSLKYCFRYAAEHYSNLFAANYYSMLCKQDVIHDRTIDSECDYFHAIMVMLVLSGDYHNFINDLQFLLPDADLLDPKAYTYVDIYSQYVSYSDLGKVVFESAKIDSVLTSRLMYGDKGAATIWACSKITGLITEKDVSTGKDTLFSYWPQLAQTLYGDCMSKHNHIKIRAYANVGDKCPLTIKKQ